MSHHNPADFKLGCHCAAKAARHRLIMVASDPHEIVAADQPFEHPLGKGLKPQGSGIIVEIIAQRYHPARIASFQNIGQPFERGAAIIGWKHCPTRRIPAALFKMQIGHQQRALGRPIERTSIHQVHIVTGKRQGCERNGNHAVFLPRNIRLGKCPQTLVQSARLPIVGANYGWGYMTDWTDKTAQARAWFESLRDQICAAFESIEREAGSDASFQYTAWEREEEGNPDPGGGVQGLMKGRVFEKVGVNVSTVRGSFAKEFAGSINCASPEAPGFVATGISLVAHMANPHVPAVHMNTRFLTTTKAWFGGGADLNPPIPYAEDTEDFHAAMRAACMGHNPTYYERYKQWADDYFYIPHREVHRGVGGIFYDHLECDDDAAFDRNLAFTQDVGRAFLDVFPGLVRKRMGSEFTPEDEAQQLEYRGRYAEFNLVYDRGTIFGLKTGGNIDAILMSLPPVATWS